MRVGLVNHVSFLENFARKFRQSEIHGLMCSLILCQSFEILFNIFICLSIPPCPFIIEVDQDAKLRSTFIQDVLIFLLLLHSLLHRSSHVQLPFLEHLCNCLWFNVLCSRTIAKILQPRQIFENFSIETTPDRFEDPILFKIHKASLWFIICHQSCHRSVECSRHACQRGYKVRLILLLLPWKTEIID